MVGEYLNEKVRAFEFRSPMLEAANNNQKFLVVDMIVTLSWNHAFAIESHEM